MCKEDFNNLDSGPISALVLRPAYSLRRRKSFKEKGWGVKLLLSGRDHQRICLSLDIFAGFNPLLNKGTTEIQYTPSQKRSIDTYCQLSGCIHHPGVSVCACVTVLCVYIQTSMPIYVCGYLYVRFIVLHNIVYMSCHL